MDSIREGLFKNMEQLESLNVWYTPLPEASYEGWGIVMIDRPAQVGRLGRVILESGFSWPEEESSRRDLWFKLKFLS